MDTSRVESQLAKLNYPSIGEDCDEFSYKPCWTCGSLLGGRRLDLIHVDAGETFREWVCIECAQYISNGELTED